jgi:lysozyme
MKKVLICVTLVVLATISVWATCFYTRTYNGIDISHHNDVCWKHIAEDPYVKFCYIKATEGKYFVDGKCEANVRDARQIDLHIGLYHYFRTGFTAKDQFNNFNKMFKKIKPDLIPVIDVESIGNDFSDIDKVNKNLSELITLFYNEYKTYPIIYFGTKEARKTFPVTYKCPFWMSSTIHPNRMPNFTMKQYKIGKIGCNTLDMNYCSDINKLKLKQM